MDLLQSLGLGPTPPPGNVVYYSLYREKLQPDQGSLAAFRVEVLELLSTHLQGYVWHKDCFELQASTDQSPAWSSTSKDPPQPPSLWGTLRYGENVEDEWFVVWLLLHVTRQLPGTAARVWDDDGEFLLIEAAYSLPKWLKPETAGNRVWLHQGQVQLLPMPGSRLLAAASASQRIAGQDVPAFPSVAAALELLWRDLLAAEGPLLDGSIQARLQDYPAKARQQVHRARCLLPAQVAHILRHEPQLVAAAVEAFCYRSSEDTRAAARMQHFAANDIIPATVPFNRCMYAQLKQSHFHPPKGYTMPLARDPTHAAADLGLKVATGFEILCMRGVQQASKRRKGGQQQEAPFSGAAGTVDMEALTGEALDPHQLEGLPGWKEYVASLRTRGVFDGELEGSERYRLLLAAAAQGFRRSAAYTRSLQRMADPAARVQELMQVPMDREDLVRGGGQPADDESWLQELAEQLDAELEQRQREMGGGGRPHGPHAPGGEDDGSASSEEEGWEEDEEGSDGEGLDAAELADKFRAFMTNISSFEGAEVPRDTGEVQFNPDSFLSELHEVLGMAPPPRRRPAAAPAAAHDAPSDTETSEEGSSFYSDSAESDSASEGDESDGNGQDSGAPKFHTRGAGAAISSRPVSHRCEVSEAVEEPPRAPPNASQARPPGGPLGGTAAVPATQSPDAPLAPTAALHPRAPASGEQLAGASVPTHAASAAPQRAAASGSGRRTEAPATSPPRLAATSSGTDGAYATTSGGGTGSTHGTTSSAGTSGKFGTTSTQPSPPLLPRPPHLHDAWEVHTETDSDDEMGAAPPQAPAGAARALPPPHWVAMDEDTASERGDDGELGGDAGDADDDFMEAYDAAMEEELAGTAMAASFQETAAAEGQDDAGPSRGAPGAAGGAARAAGEPAAGGLQPVDLDMNLVKSMLESFSSQQGLPGPAGNLAGLLGLQLPVQRTRGPPAQ